MLKPLRLRVPNRAGPKRFWSKVKKGSECWIWEGGKLKNGYGGFSIQRKHWIAHRYAYYLANGSIDADLLVCHKCDNPSCVRPDHLFQGTFQDNEDDKARKGRGLIGERHHQAVLKEADVRYIRSVYKPRQKGLISSLVAKYGVGRTAVWAAAIGKTWKHI